jgi:hypothetical protein
MKNASLRVNLTMAAIGLMTAVAALASGTKPAAAVVYCQYISYPAGCIVRPGVVLRPRPVARAVATPGRPMNRGGPVNRVGRR